MHTQEEKQLKQLLTGQATGQAADRREVLEQRKLQAQAIVQAEGGIAVLSDFVHATAYIYAGSFGRTVGIEGNLVVAGSAFEDDIFGCILPEDLVERHVMELRYYRLMQSVPIGERKDYHGACPVRFRLADGSVAHVLHRTCYLESLPNGSVWLGLCLYTPCGQAGGQPCIVNHATGRAVNAADCGQCPPLLSPREAERSAGPAGPGLQQQAGGTAAVHRHQHRLPPPAEHPGRPAGEQHRHGRADRHPPGPYLNPARWRWKATERA